MAESFIRALRLYRRPARLYIPAARLQKRAARMKNTGQAKRKGCEGEHKKKSPAGHGKKSVVLPGIILCRLYGSISASLLEHLLYAAKRAEKVGCLVRHINSLVVLAAHHLFQCLDIFHCKLVCGRVGVRALY